MGSKSSSFLYQDPRNVGVLAQGVRPKSSPAIDNFYFLSLAHTSLVLSPILGPQERLRPPRCTAQNPGFKAYPGPVR